MKHFDIKSDAISSEDKKITSDIISNRTEQTDDIKIRTIRPKTKTHRLNLVVSQEMADAVRLFAHREFMNTTQFIENCIKEHIQNKQNDMRRKKEFVEDFISRHGTGED